MILGGWIYPCSAGETFDSIALAIYGEESRAEELLHANPTLCTKTMFTGGEVLKLPVVDIPESEDGTVYMPAKAPWKE